MAAAHVVQARGAAPGVACDADRGTGRIGYGPRFILVIWARGYAPCAVTITVADLVQFLVSADVENATRILVIDGYGERRCVTIPSWEAKVRAIGAELEVGRFCCVG